MPATRHTSLKKFSHRKPLPRMRQLSRSEYVHKFLDLPGPIDRWLSANARDAWTNDIFLHGFLMMADVRKTQVFCRVEREETQAIDDPESIFTESNRFNLYLTATVSTDLEIKTSTSRVSPRAVLDTYIGLPEDLCTPEWMRWTRRTLEFRQPRDSFIALFSRMALWEDNLNRLDLSSEMISWASDISAGTWAEGKDLAPSTPRKPVKKWNSQSHKGKWDPEILNKELNGSLWEFADTPSRLGAYVITGEIPYLA